ncbi:MAG: hypothetical protein FWC26_01190 [Fibromonadales bacterium]|nr:hypothetical protein [Fibromonadales bacterium]
MKEPFLEPILRKMRIARVLPVLRQFPECKLLDVGCGWEARFGKVEHRYFQLWMNNFFVAYIN